MDDHAHRYAITCAHKPVSFAEVLDLWQHDDAFRAFFNSLLIDSPFPAFRWETPPITRTNAGRAFEFVLLESPWLSDKPDARSFAERFTADDTNEGIVAFANLGHDAVLVAPSPRGPASVYAHLGVFMRGGTDGQKHALWRVVGKTAQGQLGDSPLWISTHGGGVAWLHVRLDSRPKYYGHEPYMSYHRG